MGARQPNEKIATATDSPNLNEWLSHFDTASTPPWMITRPSRRAAAYLLDLVFLAILFIGLREVSGALLQSVWISILAFVGLHIAYFTVLHAFGGQTLAKKIFGHRVCSSLVGGGDAHIAGLPLGRAFVRETFGRVMSAAVIGVGYLRVWARSDRVAWHDQIARTRVLSVSEASNRPLPALFVIGGSGALIGGVLGLFVFVRFYTAFPLRDVADLLGREGVTIKDVKGDARTGYVIGHVTKETADFKLELERVKLMPPLLEGEGVKTLTFANVSAARAELIFKTRPALLDPAAPAAVHKKEANSVSLVVRAPEITIAEAHITMPDDHDWQLRDVKLAGLDTRVDDTRASFSRVKWDNDAVSADLREVEIDQHHVELGKTGVVSYVQVQPAFAPDVLTHAVDLQLAGRVEGSKLTALTLAGLSQKVHVKFEGDNGEVDVRDLTPYHYLKTDLPLWNMNFHLAGDLRHWNLREMKGAVGLRNVRFDVDVLAFLHRGAGKTFQLTPQLSTPWRAFLAGQQPGFTLGSSMGETARGALSDLYFSRPYERLAPQEAAMINADLRYLSNTADAVDRPIVVAPPVKPVAVVPPKSPRKPTSLPAKQKPTKLPAFKAHRHQA